MDFPAERETQALAPEGLGKALGVTLGYVGRNRFDYLVEIDSEDVLRKMETGFALLNKIPARGIIVTSRFQKRGI